MTYNMNTKLKEFIKKSPGFNEKAREFAEMMKMADPDGYARWANAGKPESMNDPYWADKVERMAGVLAMDYHRDATWGRSLAHSEAKQPDCVFDEDGVCTICGGFRLND